jgi:hypothetical protein
LDFNSFFEEFLEEKNVCWHLKDFVDGNKVTSQLGM